MSDDVTRTARPDERISTVPGPANPAALSAVFVEPRHVGRFEILGELARGGMGIVYRAHDPQIDREVAVKVLSERLMSRPEATRRFLDEARITGQLQHPGIPPVFEVGQLPDGSPYLAMKLIKGQTLDERLKRRPDPSHDRGQYLAVFEHFCQAVGYAHSRGVIHRDLKPANVMVGAFGEVQVMDWGLAKVLKSQETERPDLDPDASLRTEIRSARDTDESTQAGSLLGTPAYMPPEQAIGAVELIDQQSDVFGLGAILCAILTGQPPFVGVTAEGTRHLAAQGKLADAFARLDGCGAEPELITLCKWCLAAEKTSRPTDAGSVAAEVAALRAAAGERARRAEVRAATEKTRRRLLVRSAVAFAVVLSVGVGVSTWQWFRATAAELALAKQAEQRAKEEAANAEDAAIKAKREEAKARENERALRVTSDTLDVVSQFMQEVFAQGGVRAAEMGTSSERGGQRLSVKDAMDYAAKAIEGRFSNRPEVEVAVRSRIGKTYLELGEIVPARTQLEKALAVAERTGQNATITLDIVENLAQLDFATGRLSAAEPLFKRALVGRETTLGIVHPKTLNAASNLAVLYSSMGRSADAEPLLQRVVTDREKNLGPNHPDTLHALTNLANLYYRRGDYRSAAPLYKQALAGYEKVLGLGHPDTLRAVHNQALLYLATENHSAAEPLLRRALAGFDKVFGPEHPSSLVVARTLANLYISLRRYLEAAPLLERVVAAGAKRPEKAPDNSFVRVELGKTLLRVGKPSEAEAHLLAAYDGLSKSKSLTPVDRGSIRQAVEGLVELYDTTNQPAKAAEWRAKLVGLPPEIAPPPRPARLPG